MGTTPSRHDHQIKFKITEDAESAPARFPSSKHVPQNFAIAADKLMRKGFDPSDPNLKNWKDSFWEKYCKIKFVKVNPEQKNMDAKVHRIEGMALQMFRKVGITTLGVIENMSYYRCRHCGESDAIFGAGGGEQFAQDYTSPLLGQLPLVPAIRAQADLGKPSVIATPMSESSQCYQMIARELAIRLSLQPVNHAAKFPTIVVKADDK